MGQMIQKPDTNPIIVAVCNAFVLSALGYFLMGQQKKAIISLIVLFVGGTLTCGLIAMVWPWITAYDAYMLGQKLQSGQSIGENENGLQFLNNIFKD